MRVIVCGGRDFDDKDFLFKKLTAMNVEFGFDVIYEGGERGADTLAREWAKQANIPCKTFHADWDKFGSRAGPLRNLEMLDQKPDLVIGFAGGRGTDHMLSIARKAGIMTYRFTP